MLDQIDSWAHGAAVYYRSGNQTLRFEQEITNTGYSIDNEHGDVDRIIIHGSEGISIAMEDGILLIWSNGEVNFILKGTLPEKELIKIAESVKKQ